MNGYVVERELALSSKGSVRLARRRCDGMLVVLKERRQAELGRGKSILNEVRLLSQLRHESVVKLLSHFHDRGVLVMELEHAKFGDLGEELEVRSSGGSGERWLSSTQVLQVMRQILSALGYLHERRVVHRDIKSSNLFVFGAGSPPHRACVKGLISACPDKSFCVKIGDLGVSRECSEDTSALHSFYGTPLYASPEICKATGSYDYTTDLWSAGVLFYELVTLCHPFQGKSLMALADAICKGKFAPLPRKCNSAVRDVVCGMIRVDASTRLGVTAALALVDAALEEKRAKQGGGRDQEKSSSSPAPASPDGRGLASRRGRDYHLHRKPSSRRDDRAKGGQRSEPAVENNTNKSSNDNNRSGAVELDSQGSVQRVQTKLRRARLKLKNISLWGGCETERERDAVLEEIAHLETVLARFVACMDQKPRVVSTAGGRSAAADLDMYATCPMSRTGCAMNGGACQAPAAATTRGFRSKERAGHAPSTRAGCGSGDKSSTGGKPAAKLAAVEKSMSSGASKTSVPTTKKAASTTPTAKAATTSRTEQGAEQAKKASQAEEETDYITRQRIRVARFAKRLEEQRKRNGGRDFCLD